MFASFGVLFLIKVRRRPNARVLLKILKITRFAFIARGRYCPEFAVNTVDLHARLLLISGSCCDARATPWSCFLSAAFV
jgi:hypothetical protein